MITDKMIHSAKARADAKRARDAREQREYELTPADRRWLLRARAFGAVAAAPAPKRPGAKRAGSLGLDPLVVARHEIAAIAHGRPSVVAARREQLAAKAVVLERELGRALSSALADPRVRADLGISSRPRRRSA